MNLIGPAAGAVAKVTLEKLFRSFSKGVGGTISQLAERAGFDVARNLDSVSDFWYRGVDKEGLKSGAKIRLKGVITLDAPMCPSHPMTKTGRQIQTWIESRGKVNNFSAKDFAIWGDGIIVPPITRGRKAIVGMYDQYGLTGWASLPLILDLTTTKLNEFYKKLRQAHPIGFDVELVGRVVDLPYYLFEEAGLVIQKNEKGKHGYVPNYAIEVYKVNPSSRTIAVWGVRWIGFGKKEVFPIYTRLDDKDYYRETVHHLSEEYRARPKDVSSVFYPKEFRLLGFDKPPLNEEMEDEFRNM